jgi:hypothetical protein
LTLESSGSTETDGISAKTDRNLLTILARRFGFMIPRHPPPWQFPIILDALSYASTENCIVCSLPFSASNAFPRSTVSSNGLAFPVSTLATPRGEMMQFHAYRIPSRSICVPSAITTFAKRCFRSCPWLLTFATEFGSHLTVIGDKAFVDCSTLPSLFLPATVSHLGICSLLCPALSQVFVAADSPFFRTTGFFLTDIDGATIHVYFRRDPDIVVPREVRALSAGCFAGRITIVSVSFERGSQLSSLGASAFYSSTLTSMWIPSGVTSMGDHCFGSCDRLESPCQIPRFPAHAFECCSSLTSICIPASVESIGERCFLGSARVREVTFEPDSRFTNGAGAFRQGSLTAVLLLLRSLWTIGDECFLDCHGLEAVTFEPNCRLSSIGASAFACCGGLTSICLPAAVTAIGPGAFFGCRPRAITLEKGSTLGMSLPTSGV